MNRKGWTTVKKGSEEGYMQVRTWFVAFLGIVATLGTLLSSILLFSIVPVKRMANENHDELISHSVKMDEIERRVADNEKLVEAVSEIAGSLREIKKDIEYLKVR